MSMVWPTLGSRTAKEQQNRGLGIHILVKNLGLQANGARTSRLYHNYGSTTSVTDNDGYADRIHTA